MAYAANTIRSRDIVNDAVTSADIKGGGGKTGDVKNRDVNKSLAVAKGFATVDASAGNGIKPILNGGGQQTANLPGGIGAVRTGTGQYTVTFNANTGTGKFSGVDNLSDLATQAAVPRHRLRRRRRHHERQQREREPGHPEGSDPQQREHSDRPGLLDSVLRQRVVRPDSIGPRRFGGAAR